MAYYMLQVAYTSEAWGSQVKNPQSVIDRTRPVTEGLGGSIESTYYTKKVSEPQSVTFLLKGLGISHFPESNFIAEQPIDYLAGPPQHISAGIIQGSIHQ